MSRVLITCGGGAYGLGVARSLKAAGHYVIATDADRYSFQRAEGDERLHVPRASSGETFLSAISELVNEKQVDFVWPGHDSDILAFARERDRLGAATFLPTLNEIEICRDKWRSYQRFQRAGVTVPETMMISSRADLRAAFETFDGQVWLRAIRGAGGRQAMGTDSTRKAEAWLDLHDGWGLFSAARRIKGGQRLSWESVWANGELIAVQGRTQLLQGFEYLTISHVTGVPGVNQWGTPPAADDVGAAAVRAVSDHPHGNYGVDMVTDADGAPYVTEINIGRYNNDGLIHWPDETLNAADLAVRLGLGEEPQFEPPLMHPKPRGSVIIYGMPTLPIEVSADELGEPPG